MNKVSAISKISALFLIISIFIAGCSVAPNQPEINANGSKTGSNDAMTQEQCSKAKGYWNECGSPCAGTDAEMCIQVCAQQCQCGGIAGFGCPEGYKCRLTGKIADEMGVCVKN